MQLEDLSDASVLSKLLLLPTNVWLDWKVSARYKHSSLFGRVISNEEKKSYNIDTRCQCHKSLFVTDALDKKKHGAVCVWEAFVAKP